MLKTDLPLTSEDITFVFDFDSTLTAVEAFEELGEISLAKHPSREQKIQQIKQITDLGIDGEISFTESLERRITILQANQTHLEILINRLKKKISDSVKRNKAFFKIYAPQIIVISAGFKEFIIPILKPYGITPERIYANTFQFDSKGNILGFDSENPLSKPDGKIYQLKELGLSGRIFVIGDGYSDYQMREAGIAHKFFAYTENITREKILNTADHITPSFDEFLFINKIKGSISYPKNRIVALLESGCNPCAEALFANEGYAVKWASQQELIANLADASILCTSESSTLEKLELSESKRLLCAGSMQSFIENEKLVSFTNRGIPVFHSPKAEAAGRVEWILGRLLEIAKLDEQGLGLLSQLTIGISGMGSEGYLLSKKLEALGVKTYYFAPAVPENLGRINRVESFAKLLDITDAVVLCRNFKEEYPKINASSFQPKKVTRIFTTGGFSAISLDVLKQILQAKNCLSAALDTSSAADWEELRMLSLKFRLDFSLNASTNLRFTREESARNIAKSLIDYVNSGNTQGCINLPPLKLPEFPSSHRLLHIHQNVPGVLADINAVFSQHRININHQHLTTNKHIGYLITDIDKKYDSKVLEALKKVPATVRFRVLY